MATNRELFSQFLAEIRQYESRTAYKVNLHLDKIEAALGKPLHEAQTASEIEQAVIRAADSRKKHYNGGHQDSGERYRFRLGQAACQYLRFCYGNGIIIRNIYGRNTFREPFKTEAEWLKPDQVEKLLNTESLSITEQAIIRFILDTGVRREEFQSVKKRDVNKQTRLVHIPYSKGMKWRTVPFTEKTLFWLELYEGMKAKQLQIKDDGIITPDSEWLFSDVDGGQLGYSLIGDIFHHISRKVGMRVSCHILRHTAATAWLSARNPDGSPVCSQIEVMRFLGHESVSMTQGYIHSTGAQLSFIQKKVYESLGIK